MESSSPGSGASPPLKRSKSLRPSSCTTTTIRGKARSALQSNVSPLGGRVHPTKTSSENVFESPPHSTTSHDGGGGKSRRPLVYHNVEVDFPYDVAMASQQVVMSNVLRALTEGHNALIESPTGTGKTAALLCAALAWQKYEKARLSSSTRQPATPRVYYCTRTHAQVHQVVQELRKTQYRPPLAILASRKQYCIHPDVKERNNRNAACKKLVNGSKGCGFKQRKSLLTGHSDLQPGGPQEVWDIEDLVELGTRHGACPYFSSKTLSKRAEFIICPYNHILDGGVRDSFALPLKGSIVILDEGHNVEGACRNAASLQTPLVDFIIAQRALSDLDGLIRRRRTGGCPLKHTAPDRWSCLVRMIDAMTLWGSECASSLSTKDFWNAKCVWEGKDMRKVLERWGISHAHVQSFVEAHGALKEDLATLEDAAIRHPISSGTRTLLDRLERLWGFMFPATSAVMATSASSSPPLPHHHHHHHHHLRDYRIVLRRVRKLKQATIHRDDDDDDDGDDVDHDKGESQRLCLSSQVASMADDVKGVELVIWAMHGGVGFAPLLQCRTVVVASGTLSPLEPFAGELQASFPTRIVAPHCLPRSQVNRHVWMGVLSRARLSDAQKSLRVSYRHVDSFDLQDGLGLCILEVCKVVPQGVLVFLPSHALLTRLMTRWNATGLLEELRRVKRVFHESSGTTPTPTHEYNEAAEASKGPGALLLAVCRGRASEGTDFKDGRCRAVMVVGIPYPAAKDVGVELKREFNTRNAHAMGLLGGSEWYRQQAMRAASQAVGRVLRHANDCGAVILVDARFLEPRALKSLPSWLPTPPMKPNSAEEAGKALKSFFAQPHIKTIINQSKKGKKENPRERYSSVRKRKTPTHNLAVGGSAPRTVALRSALTSRRVVPRKKTLASSSSSSRASPLMRCKHCSTILAKPERLPQSRNVVQSHCRRIFHKHCSKDKTTSRAPPFVVCYPLSLEDITSHVQSPKNGGDDEVMPPVQRQRRGGGGGGRIRESSESKVWSAVEEMTFIPLYCSNCSTTKTLVGVKATRQGQPPQVLLFMKAISSM